MSGAIRRLKRAASVDAFASSLGACPRIVADGSAAAGDHRSFHASGLRLLDAKVDVLAILAWRESY
jgi:hypothetical protein